MISPNQFRKGHKIKFEGDIYIIVDFQHVKMGRGGAIIRTKLKNMKTGQVLDKTFRPSDTFETPDFAQRTMQYLYSDDEFYHFMDSSNFEQVGLSVEQIGEYKNFLQENVEYKILFFEGEPISIDMPSSIVLTVVEAEPGVKGDSVSNLTKNAKVETGLTVRVPLFVKEGDKIKIDTRTGEYLSRA